MKLHRDIKVRQSTAWHLAQRIRKGFEDGTRARISGPVEADGSHLGNKEANKQESKRLRSERDAVVRTTVAGIKDRPTKRVGKTHTNGIENSWTAIRRGYYGTYHQMSAKHLQRYVNKFSGQHNTRDLDIITQMGKITRGLVGKRLRYQDLIA